MPESRPGATARFFALAFLFTWSLQVPAVLAQRGLLPGPAEGYLPFAMLGVLGPLAAATLLTARTGGRPAVRALFGSLSRWRAPWWCYLAALVVPGALLSLGLWALGFAGYPGEAILAPDAGRLLVIPVIAIGEEVGWRGYALPRLRRRYGPFAASVILGAVWTVWHIPMFLGVGVPMSTLPVMLLFFVGGSLWFTWIQSRAGGSLLLVVLAHAGAHLNNAHVTLPGDALPLLVGAVVYAGLGVAVVYLDRTTFPLDARRRAGSPSA